MFKNILRLFFALIIILIIFVSYLSFFGIKTDKFNHLIKSQIQEIDKRLDLELNKVFIKLNLRQKSFSINGKNVNLLIQNQSQQLANVNVLIGLETLFKNQKNIKKIIINSNKTEVKKLLKFIRAYKINIPALYLENSISEGFIVYNLTLESNNKKNKLTYINGEITNAKINFLQKQFENINFKFEYSDKSLNIKDLNLIYDKTKFLSNDINANIKDNTIEVKGDFKNKINLSLLSNLFDLDINNYLEKNILLSSKSNFTVLFNKKFKMKDYKLESQINIEDLNIVLKKIDLKKYISDFNNKIILKNGELKFNLNKSKSLSVKIKSKFVFNESQKSKDLTLKNKKNNSGEKYEFNIDLSENDVFIDLINFQKGINEELFLNINASKKNNEYNINNFKLFNKKNMFNLKSIEFSKNFKIKDFHFVSAKFFNKKNFLNDISIKKNNENIKLTSNNFDISSNIEKSLKSSNESSFLEFFYNLDSTFDINIKSARLDEDHDLVNLRGSGIIKGNKIDKVNIFAKFNRKGNFTYTKDELDGKKVTTVFSDIAKPFVKKFKFIKGFENGKLDLTSTEIEEGISKSELRVYDFKLKDMPALTKLLSLASLQGIADLATGEGIRFDEFDMFFDNSKNLIKIHEIYALGPAISVLMEGYVEKNKLVSLRGTLVPATTINKTIAKIPLLGNILVGDKAGEGVFGVSFKIKGPPENLDTRVNPIKTLTPRFITRTLDEIKKSN